MSTEWGFVYIIENHYMPNLYKIGYTTRPPQARIEELSRATGVPCEFAVFMYGETPTASAAERELHRLLAEHRVNPEREFFRLDVDALLSAVDFLNEECWNCSYGDSHSQLMYFIKTSKEEADSAILAVKSDQGSETE